MTEQKDHSKEVKDSLWVLIIGLGVGWLAGLSVSPVATILISGLLGIAIAIVGIISISLTYRDDKDKTIRSVGFKAAEEISIGLLALIVFGIALGVSLGICARTHNFLGTDDELALTELRLELNELQSHCDNKKWTELGIDKKMVARRILDKYYPKGDSSNNSTKDSSNSNKKSALNPEGLGFLYSAKGTSNACDEVRGFPRSILRNEINGKNRFVLFRKISEIIHDDTELEKTINVICEQIENSVESKE